VLILGVILRYSLRPILFIANMNIFRHILVLDTSVFTISNMSQRSTSNYSEPFICAGPIVQIRNMTISVVVLSIFRYQGHFG
jgi:hypothetical protein